MSADLLPVVTEAVVGASSKFIRGFDQEVAEPSSTATATTVNERLSEHPLPKQHDLPPYDDIPSSCRSLKECAAHQIRTLLLRDAAGTTLTPLDEDCLDDGFVLSDLSVIANKFHAWRRMFPRIKPFYAIKCNPDPVVTRVLGDLGCGFDCASLAELSLAQEAMMHHNRMATATTKTSSTLVPNHKYSIVYAHPQRAEMDLATCLNMFSDNPIPLTFDGPEELHKIRRAYDDAIGIATATTQSNTPTTPPPPDVILRLLVPDGQSSIPLGEKFGAPATAVQSLVAVAVSLDLTIAGVSFHCGSGNHDPDSYRTAILLAKQAMEDINRWQEESRNSSGRAGTSNDNTKCTLLDIGGGYPGWDGMEADQGRFCGGGDADVSSEQGGLSNSNEHDNDETTRKIADVVTPLLDDLFPVTTTEVELIAEPGRYFVEAAFALCARIYRTTTSVSSTSRSNDNSDTNHSPKEERHYYIAQGVQGIFKDCVLCNESFVPIPLRLNELEDTDGDTTTTSEELFSSFVHGPSGESYDVICRDYPLPRMEVGDWLVFDRMGAYTLSIAARNGRPPVRYVRSKSREMLE